MFRGGPVDSRADEWMMEGDTSSDLEEPVRLSRPHRRGSDAKSLGGTRQQPRVPGRLGRRDKQQLSGLGGQGSQPLPVTLLNANRDGVRPQNAKAAGQLLGAHPSR